MTLDWPVGWWSPPACATSSPRFRGSPSGAETQQRPTARGIELVPSRYPRSSAKAPRSPRSAWRPSTSPLDAIFTSGGQLLITSHAAFPPDANVPHTHDQCFLTLTLQLWEVLLAETPQRDATEPDDSHAMIDDVVVLARRTRPPRH